MVCHRAEVITVYDDDSMLRSFPVFAVVKSVHAVSISTSNIPYFKMNAHYYELSSLSLKTCARIDA